MNYKPGTFKYIEAKIRADAKGTEFGLGFEKLCKHYLETSPLFKNNLKKVWLWKEWPDRWKQPEHGIDLVAISHDGDYWAIQAKCFKPSRRVTYDDIDSFLAESSRKLFSYRLLIATTNKIGSNARDAIEGKGKYAQVIPVGTHLRDELVKAEVTWPTDINKKPRPFTSFDPRPYQKKAINNVIEKFKKADKGQLIMACGTGKTFTSIKIAERLKAKRILVLVPSLNLVNQSIKEWNHNYKTQFKMCVVCSDETVVKGKDAAILSTASLSLPPTTNARKIKAFLKQRTKNPQVVFCTYQSSNKIAEAQKKDFIKFDLVLADEAHRCAGLSGETYGLVIDDRKIKSKKKLFMTATPRIIGDRVKKHAEDVGQEIFSMCDREKFGEVFHELKFSDAIKDKILTNYQVAVVGVIGDKNKNFVTEGQIIKVEKNVQTDARTLASQIGLAKAIKKYNLQKIITFHSSVAKAKKFGVSSSLDNNNLEAFSDLIPKLPKKVVPTKNIWTQAISGEMPVDRRIDYLNILEKPDRNSICLIANCRCLSEGVDVPALDGVGFMDPKSSQIDIIQAVGRAIRKSDTKKIGTIFIPVFIDEKDDVDTTLSNSAFKPVWSVIRALRSHDDDLADKLDAMRISLGQNKKISLPTKITFDLPTKLSIKSFQEAFYIKTIESTTTNWDAMVKLLKEYKNKYGHFNPPKKMPKRWEGLFEWVHGIRLAKGRNALTSEKISELDELNFCWNVPGQTLTNTKGLLVENKFAIELGVGNHKMAKFRKEGLIKPAGTGISFAGLSFFYYPKQIKEFRKKLGVTLIDTKGLLSQQNFRQKIKLRLGRFNKYLEEGLIKPVGKGIVNTSAGIANFYHPKQIKEFEEVHKKKLGITLTSTKGLLTESQFAAKVQINSGFLGQIRKNGLIKPVGAGITTGGKSYYYHPRQVKEARKKLGITLTNTKGLLTEAQFVNKLAISIHRLRKIQDKIGFKPIGSAFSKVGKTLFYHPRQVKEFRKKLGITLTNTKGLLTEKKFRSIIGITRKLLVKSRENGLIKPIGTGFSEILICDFYHPRQIKDLRKKLGITLTNTKGLFTKLNFIKKAKTSTQRLKRYQKEGLIKPFGIGVSPSGLTDFYHPKQIKEVRKIKKKLGATIDDETKGLLNEESFSKKLGIHVVTLRKYRKQGLIKPAGTGFFYSRLTFFYHPRQIKEFRKKLGITLTTTKGLLSQPQFAIKLGVQPRTIERYREKGLIKPKGTWYLNGLLNYYHPRQIKEFRKKLGITLTNTKGLLVTKQFALKVGKTPKTIKKYKEEGFIKPIGFWLTSAGLSDYYHPRQVAELKKKLKNK